MKLSSSEFDLVVKLWTQHLKFYCFWKFDDQTKEQLISTCTTFWFVWCFVKMKNWPLDLHFAIVTLQLFRTGGGLWQSEKYDNFSNSVIGSVHKSFHKLIYFRLLVKPFINFCRCNCGRLFSTSNWFVITYCTIRMSSTLWVINDQEIFELNRFCKSY